MIKKSILSSVFVALAILPVSGFAVLIDFESYADRSNIAGVNLGGVTLSSPGNGDVIEIYDNRFGVSSHSGTRAIGNFEVIDGAPVNVPLIGVFDEAVSGISLWAGDAGGAGGDEDSWTLNLYDAAIGGNLITSLSSSIFNGFPYEEIAYTGTDIWRFEAIWTGPGCCGVGFDDLEFTVASASVPEPSALLLLSLGLLGIGFGKKRFFSNQ